MVTILSSSALALLLIFFPAPTLQRSPGLANGASSLSIAAQSTQPANPSTASTSDKKEGKVTAYILPPDLYRKARHLAQIAFWGQIALFLYSIIVLLVILKWRLAAKYRAWAEGVSANRFLQAAIFSPLTLLTIAIFESPGDIGQHWVSRKFGLSVQGWGSWSWDWTKSQIIAVIIGIIVILDTLRGDSQKPAALVVLVLDCVAAAHRVGNVHATAGDRSAVPQVRAAAEKDPALTAALEQMVQRAGENIPPQRMFWMGASEKSTELNAYVTGIGASKRIVVWDTTIAKMTTPQIVFVAGHEMGHYVLYHIPKGLAFAVAVFLGLFYLGYLSIRWVLARWGNNWEIRGVGDWASFPALLLLLTIFSFANNPLANAISRHYEHQADQYGLEVTHGLTPDSGRWPRSRFRFSARWIWQTLRPIPWMFSCFTTTRQFQRESATR